MMIYALMIEYHLGKRTNTFDKKTVQAVGELAGILAAVVVASRGRFGHAVLLAPALLLIGR